MPAERMGSPGAIRVLFGPFELSIAERSLRKAGEVVPIGGRTFDIHAALIGRGGEVVSKAELIAQLAALTIWSSQSTGNSPKASRRPIWSLRGACSN